MAAFSLSYHIYKKLVSRRYIHYYLTIILKAYFGQCVNVSPVVKQHLDDSLVAARAGDK